MTDTDQTTPLERAEEHARDLREQAAATSVALLGKTTPEGVSVDLTDVIDLANWLLSGTHPLDRVSPRTMTLQTGPGRLYLGPLGATPWHTMAGGRVADRIDTDDVPEPVDATIVCGASSPQYELTCGLPEGHQPFRLAEPGHLPKTWEHATGERGGTAWEGTTAVTFSGGITYLQPRQPSPVGLEFPVDLDPSLDATRGQFPDAGTVLGWPVTATLANDPDTHVLVAMFDGVLHVAPVGTLPTKSAHWRPVPTDVLMPF